MRHLAAPPWLGHEFDNFLFAMIEEDRNGLQLSVVSALGRSNLDPWEEAASLTKLPKEIATQRLASLLGALRNPALQQDSGTMATRLIALLPLPTKSRTRLTQSLIGADTDTHTRVRMHVLLIVIYMIGLLGTELIVAYYKAGHINSSPAIVPSTAPLQALPTPYR